MDVTDGEEGDMRSKNNLFPQYRVVLRAMVGTIGVGVFLVTSAAEAQTARTDREPRPGIYRAKDGEWRVDLPPAVEDALRKYDRDFEMWEKSDYRGVNLGRYDFSARQVPWAVIGDFNNDGRIDVAVAGRTEDKLAVVMVLSEGRRSYRAKAMDVEPYDPEERRRVLPPVLRYVYPGRYRVDHRDGGKRKGREREIEIRRPAVQMTGGRRSSAVLYVVERGEVSPYYLIRGIE
jgi:hypothetical protein